MVKTRWMCHVPSTEVVRTNNWVVGRGFTKFDSTIFSNPSNGVMDVKGYTHPIWALQNAVIQAHTLHLGYFII